MITLLATLVVLAAAVVVDRLLRRADRKARAAGQERSDGLRPAALGPAVDADGCRVFAMASYHPSHLFVVEGPGETASIGLDDLAMHLLGAVHAWRLPRPGVRIRQGECVLEAETSAGAFSLPAPTSGRVVAVRGSGASGSEPGWLLDVRLENAAACSRNLIRGDLARGWMRDSVACARALSEPRGLITRSGGLPDLSLAAPGVRAMLITILLSAQPVEEGACRSSEP
jgi:glycine cleavage system H lipoate-binding protein